MKTTIEISKYPLNEVYKAPIKEFIKRLNSHAELKIKTSTTNTLITGNYNKVMSILQDEIKVSFEKYGKVVFVMKVFQFRYILVKKGFNKWVNANHQNC